MLELQKPFPAFSLEDDKGVEKTNRDFAQRWLVLYFYPKDNTSG